MTSACARAPYISGNCLPADRRTSESSRSGDRRRHIRIRTEALPYLFNQIAAIVAQHELTMEPEGRGTLGEQRVVKRSEVERFTLLRLVVLAELEQHQLADGVDEICRIECATLRLTPRTALLHERLVTEVADPLLHGHVLRVQLDADDE